MSGVSTSGADVDAKEAPAVAAFEVIVRLDSGTSSNEKLEINGDVSID